MLAGCAGGGDARAVLPATPGKHDSAAAGTSAAPGAAGMHAAFEPDGGVSGDSATPDVPGGGAAIGGNVGGSAGGVAGRAGAAGRAGGSAGRAGSSGAGGKAQPPAAGSGGAAPGVDPSDALFDLTQLHDVRVYVATTELDTLRTDRDARIAATAYVDGQKLEMIVTHRKGFTTASASKPSLVLDFDDTVKTQKLNGLTKLVLSNALQDPSFLNEHLAYEFVRKAGLPAPRTAHAVLTLNDEVLGLYILEEDVNKGYLARWFGATNKSGNLYEGSLRDFVPDQSAGMWPTELDLKGEADEGRTRDDIVALAKLVESASDADYAAALSVSMDFDSFVTAFAIDVITSNTDDYCYASNNYYLYHNPRDDRFVLLLHGMDFLFSTGVTFPVAKPDAYVDPFIPLADLMAGSGPGRMAARLRAIPALETRLHAEVGRLIRTVWNVDQLSARIEQVAKVLHTTTRTDEALLSDIASFDAQRPVMLKLLADRKAYLESVTP